jgi:hypothetical protein
MLLADRNTAADCGDVEGEREINNKKGANKTDCRMVQI